MKYLSKQAFTLVELLVTISILAILITISSVYLFSNFGDSRDASRKSSISTMSNSLELYFVQNGNFPEPDAAQAIMYQDGIAWKQGTFGGEVTRKIKDFGSDIPLDPQYKNEFSYSLTNRDREYQLATILEGLKSEESLGELSNILIPQAHAALETAYVQGNYNKLLLRVETSTGTYFIASPSIIASDLSQTGVLDIITGKKLVYHEFFNLPASYGDYVDTAGGFNFQVLDPIIYSGSLDILQTKDGLEDFSRKLQYIYATTPTESFDLYISFLKQEGVSKIKEFLTKNYKIPFPYGFNCQDLSISGKIIESGIYVIDEDGAGGESPKNVYCSIDEEKHAWTRIDGNHLGTSNAGNFPAGVHIPTYFHSLYTTYAQNTIVALATPTGSYALRQTGDSFSNYEVHFSDFSQITSGDEIRMRLWVADELDGGWTNTIGVNPQQGYMFHNRVYYTDGTFSSNGEAKILATTTVAGKTWKQLEVKHRVRKTPQSFAWYIGLDAENTKNLFFAGVELELYRY